MAASRHIATPLAASLVLLTASCAGEPFSNAVDRAIGDARTRREKEEAFQRWKAEKARASANTQNDGASAETEE